MAAITPYTSTQSLLQEGWLCKRAFDSLTRTGLFTIKDIVDYVKAGNLLSEIMDLDCKSDHQIRYLLLIRKFYGEKIDSTTIAPTLLNVADVTFKEIFTRVFNQKISATTRLNISPYLSRRYPNEERLFEVFVAGTDNIFQIQPSLNSDELREYRLWHIEFLEELIEQLPVFKKIKHPLLDPFSRLHKDTKKLYVQFYIRKTLNPLKVRWSIATDEGIDASPAQSNSVGSMKTSPESLNLDKLSSPTLEIKSSNTEQTSTQNNSHPTLRENNTLNTTLSSAHSQNNDSNKTHTQNNDSNKTHSQNNDSNNTQAQNYALINDSNKSHSQTLNLTQNNDSERPQQKIDIPEEFSEFLHQRYQALSLENLGPWGRKFQQQHLPGYKDAVNFFNRPLDDYYDLIPTRTFRKNLTEIYRLVQLFQGEVKDLLQEYSQGGRRFALEYQCQRLYPFLSEEECVFTARFIEHYNARPLLFLLYRLLQSSQKRECLCFSLYYGLKDGREHSLEEIASQMGVTSKTIRLIISSHQSILSLLKVTPEEIECYRQKISSHIITKESPEFISLIEKENLPEDFASIGALCSLLLDYKIFSFEDVSFLVSPYFDSRRIKQQVCGRFNPLCSKAYTEDTLFPFTYFTDGIAQEFHPQVKWLLSVLARNRQNVSITQEGVLIGQTKLDISKELYQILSEAGSPLSLEQLFVRFKEKFPEHKYTQPSQIRSFLFNNEHILSLGNQGLYGLDIWENVYFGTIKDLLFETLQESPLPMHIDQLYSLVKKHYPSTSIESLKASIGTDPYNRFVRFEDGYFGIYSRYYPKTFIPAKGTKNKHTKVTHTDRDFDKHLRQVEFFIQRNHRYPFKNGGLAEAALSRWVDRALSRGITLSKAQKEKLNALIEKFSDSTYPRNPREYNFLLRCQDFKAFTHKHRALPSTFTDNALYTWFRVNKERYNLFDDHRRQYFLDLCQDLLAQGFDIQL